MVKWINTPVASETLVTSGPLAVAGSSRKRLSRKGGDMPTELPISTTTNIVSLAAITTSQPPRHAPSGTTTAAIVAPSAAATAISRKIRSRQSFIYTSPVASARTIRVADCDPALPLLSIRSRRKNTSET